MRYNLFIGVNLPRTYVAVLVWLGVNEMRVKILRNAVKILPLLCRLGLVLRLGSA